MTCSSTPHLRVGAPCMAGKGLRALLIEGIEGTDSSHCLVDDRATESNGPTNVLSRRKQRRAG